MPGRGSALNVSDGQLSSSLLMRSDMACIGVAGVGMSTRPASGAQRFQVEEAEVEGWEPMQAAPKDAPQGIEVLLPDGTIEHAAWFPAFGEPAWRDLRCPERVLNPVGWRWRVPATSKGGNGG
jgi:hypothetical protein